MCVCERVCALLSAVHRVLESELRIFPLHYTARTRHTLARGRRGRGPGVWRVFREAILALDTAHGLARTRSRSGKRMQFTDSGLGPPFDDDFVRQTKPVASERTRRLRFRNSAWQWRERAVFSFAGAEGSVARSQNGQGRITAHISRLPYPFVYPHTHRGTHTSTHTLEYYRPAPPTARHQSAPKKPPFGRASLSRPAP